MTHTFIQHIHPLNAEYLLTHEPHRLYLDQWGNVLELTVRRFSSLVVERLYEHGGIVMMGYHDAATEGKMSFYNTCILRRDGEIFSPYPLAWRVQRIWLDIDIFYMLLNPVEMNGWILEKRKECHNELRDRWHILDIPRIFYHTKMRYLDLLLKGNI